MIEANALELLNEIVCDGHIDFSVMLCIMAKRKRPVRKHGAFH